MYGKPIKTLSVAIAMATTLATVSGCSDDDDNSPISSSSEMSSSSVAVSSASSSSTAALVKESFNRTAVFPVCSQIADNCNDNTETVAEIVTASKDGMTLIYTDSPQDQIGFIDITDPGNPQKAGTVALGAEPTSVSVIGNYAVAAINTSADYVNTSGSLVVVDIASQTILKRIDLGGQPDSVAVSPDENYIAIAIENERDEDDEVTDGRPPQAPAGFVMVVDASGDVANWQASKIDLDGIADLYSGDPEPEFVDINSDNIAVVSLQENNHLVLIDLATKTVTTDFSAGEVDLVNVDATEEDPARILATENLDGVLREPDGVSWIGDDYFATANEGDMDGGSRGFTIFDKVGNVVFESDSLDHIAIRHGHYPDGRSENKGNEPENVEYAMYGDKGYLFVNSERSNLVFVYDVTDPTAPVFKQALPTGVGPEGSLAIPSRNLLVVASEVDERDAKIRSSVSIYTLENGEPNYPTLASANLPNSDQPIAWGAMSGLAAGGENRLYAIDDSFYGSNRIFAIDTSTQPATITSTITLKDSNDVFASIATDPTPNPMPVEDEAPDATFDANDLAAMINSDKTVNLDPEGIAMASDGGFWIASEGNGSFNDKGRHVKSLNFIVKIDALGVIEEVIALPQEVNAIQLRFGFEGIAESNGKLVVAFQRAWNNEANPRIGIYDLAAKTWDFVYYPLETVSSQYGGWVGLSDLTALENNEFLVVERDNQGGPDAAIKRLYTFSLEGYTAGSTVTKTLVRDLMDDLKAPNGLIYEKIEGSAVMPNGDVYIINDNDGIDDNSGETQLINLGQLLAL